MPFDGDPFAFYGKRIIEEHHASLLQRLPKITVAEGDPDPLDISDDILSLKLNKKVGILGAGIGGLYTALILDSLDIDYEILEASHRAGGRLRTHKFKDGGEWDYYEEGAMRFPLPPKENGKYKNGVMKRLAELTEYGPLNQGSNPLRDTLIPFYYNARDKPGDKPAFYYINGVHHPVGKVPEPSGFKAKEMGVPAAYIKAGFDGIHQDAINPFVRAVIEDIVNGTEHGWSVLKENDAYSVRAYLATKYLPSYSLNLLPRHLSNNIVNWVNLLENSSGAFDRALTEDVFEAIAFAQVGDIDFGKVEWKCFRGGTETLSKSIVQYLLTKNKEFIKYDQRVTTVEQVYTDFTIPSGYEGKEIPSSAKRTVLNSGVIDIDIEGEAAHKKKPVKHRGLKVTTTNEHGTQEYKYGHVISTLPLPVLRTINLRNAGLNVLQRNALRALDYGASVKIALRFKSAWWTEKLGITGGQSFTDLPIRTIVYPSYGVDSNPPSKVLIASYTWTTDAQRLGALSLKQNKKILKDLVLHNLAEAHQNVNQNKEITYEFLVKDLADGENFHVQDWTNDEYTMGAFADFSPGEFERLYVALNYPAAEGSLHFAGEALSTRHAWVVGALDSAWKAVYQYLKLTRQRKKLDRFLQLWGANVEWYTKSTILDNGADHDLLDEHIALLQKALLVGAA